MPEWLSGTAGLEICSVSPCVAEPPPEWISSCYRNGLAEPARLEMPFGQPQTEPLSPEPLSSQFAPLGFHAVSNSGSSYFGCSPLSCNRMGETLGVNRHCLLDSLEVAEEAARQFSVEQPEPGIYYVVQVLRAARRRLAVQPLVAADR